jgi:hypothetical protein
VPELLDDTRVKLEAAALVPPLVFGTNLFGGTLPAGPNFAVAMYEPSGAGPVEVMGPGLPAEDNPRLQVVVRSEPNNYVQARSVAWSIWRILAGVVDETINGTRYLRIAAVHSPSFLTRDDNERVLFVCNFEVLKDLSA